MYSIFQSDYLDTPRVVLAIVQTDTYGTYMNTSKVLPDNTADIQIADRIMHAMIVKGITLKALSEATGISYTGLRRSLHQTRPDKRSFTLKEFHKIADALTTPPAALLPEEWAEEA